MISAEEIEKNLRFETSRSSGPGGQHVNKTETKVTVYFNIEGSSLTEAQKTKLIEFNQNRINKDGAFFLSVMTHRSQAANKEAAILKVIDIIQKSIIPKKKRIATTASKASIEKRLESKKIQSERKRNRKLDL